MFNYLAYFFIFSLCSCYLFLSPHLHIALCWGDTLQFSNIFHIAFGFSIMPEIQQAASIAAKDFHTTICYNLDCMGSAIFLLTMLCSLALSSIMGHCQLDIYDFHNSPHTITHYF
jgi:hypothetical protein